MRTTRNIQSARIGTRRIEGVKLVNFYFRSCGNKRRYVNGKQVRKAISTIERLNKRVLLTYYKCEFCMGLHLTKWKGSK